MFASMDLDEYFFHNDSSHEKIKEFKDLLLKKSESFIKLKKKIIATSSVLTAYKDMKNECINLKKLNADLNEKFFYITNEYKEALVQKISYDKDVTSLRSEHETLLEKYKALVDQDNGKAATIKQLRDYTSEIKNKLESIEIENEMLKSKAKEDVEYLKNDLKTLKSSHKIKMKGVNEKITNIFHSLKSLRRELKGRCSITELKYFKLIIDDLNQIKGSKFVFPQSSSDDIHYFDDDNESVLSPASADTGKGSSVCTSDDEKCVAVLDKQTYLSPNTRNRKSVKSISPVKLKSSTNNINSGISVDGPQKIKIDCLNNTFNSYDDEYIQNILQKMSKPVPLVSPLPWNNLDDIPMDTPNPSTTTHYCKYSCIKKKKKISSQNLAAIIKQAVKVEVRNLLKYKQLVRTRAKRKVLPSNKINTSSLKISKIKLRHIENKIVKKQKSLNINNISKSRKVKCRKQIEKCAYISKSQDIQSKPMKNDRDIENDKKINKAKELLMKFKECDSKSREKTFVKWKTGSTTRDITLVKERNESNNQETQLYDIEAGELPSMGISKTCNTLPSTNVTLLNQSFNASDTKETNQNGGSNCTEEMSHVYNNDLTDININGLNDAGMENTVIDNTAIDKDNNIELLPTDGEEAKTFPLGDMPFRLLVSDYLGNSMERYTFKDFHNKNLCDKLEKFLLCKFTADHLDSFTCGLSKEREECIVNAIIEFISSSERYNDPTYHQYPMLPMTESHQAVLILINKLSLIKSNITELVMRGIEYKIFKLNDTPPLKSLQNMTPLYVALCRLTQQKDRLKLFCFDALYCLSYSAAPIVYLILQCWPALIPKSHFYNSNDPLLITMIHFLLGKFSTNLRYNSKDLQQLLHKNYGYKTGEYTDSSILHLLLDYVQGNKHGRFNSILSAFLLLGKRTGVEWCYNNIILKSLIPIIDDPEASSSSKAMAISLIGPLTRPFPDKKMLQCNILFKKLLNLFDKGNPCLDEAVLSSLNFFRRKDSEFYKILFKWKPSYSLPQGVIKLLEEILSGKHKSFWKTKLEEMSNDNSI